MSLNKDDETIVPANCQPRSKYRGLVISIFNRMGPRAIAVIEVAPTGKASLVYSYVQTRLVAQYNGI